MVGPGGRPARRKNGSTGDGARREEEERRDGRGPRRASELIGVDAERVPRQGVEGCSLVLHDVVSRRSRRDQFVGSRLLHGDGRSPTVLDMHRRPMTAEAPPGGRKGSTGLFSPRCFSSCAARDATGGRSEQGRIRANRKAGPMGAFGVLCELRAATHRAAGRDAVALFPTRVDPPPSRTSTRRSRQDPGKDLAHVPAPPPSSARLPMGSSRAATLSEMRLT
jgi:hypothetical protein